VSSQDKLMEEKLAAVDSMPLNESVCWYQWDPEMKTFRRGCEGD
jgi:hypothetical protein